jgi:Putative abortive phage resistance protein AbiGi, antitoxin
VDEKKGVFTHCRKLKKLPILIMQIMDRVSLHSNHLYHFKRDFNILLLILKNGFQHRKWKETIPFFGLDQENFMICFSDLRFEDSLYHRKCYGQNALVMTKSWARKNKISPVRYIHKDSPGMSEKYMELKTLFRNAMEPDQTVVKVITYLTSSQMYIDGKLLQGDLRLLNYSEENLINELESECKYIEHNINSDKTERLYKWLFTMFSMIVKLHDELELRDAYVRNYIEDFPCPATKEKIIEKILYDEREWRSIIFPIKNELNDPEIKRCIAEGFLPIKYNLTFNDDDIISILVETEEQKSQLTKEIDLGTTMLSNKSLQKIELFGNYIENDKLITPAKELTGEYHRISTNPNRDI